MLCFSGSGILSHVFYIFLFINYVNVAPSVFECWNYCVFTNKINLKNCTRMMCKYNLKKLLFYYLLSQCFISVICEKEKKLQIGIKKRLKHCDIKTKKGDFLHVHYKGMFENEEEFDNSYVRNTPLSFTLGMGQVIKGWDQGLIGMCIGEIRKLVVPPHLGYGAQGVPPTIPADATLVFHVELLNIEEREDL